MHRRGAGPVVLVTCFLAQDPSLAGVFRRFAAELKSHGGSLIVAWAGMGGVDQDAQLGFDLLPLPQSLAEYDVTEFADDGASSDPFHAWLAEVDANWADGVHGRDVPRSLSGIPHCVHVARKVMDALRPSVAFIWSSGVYPVSRVWQDVARQQGIPAFCVERGFLPGTWMIDAGGMNAQGDMRVHPVIRRLLLDHRATGRIEAYRQWHSTTRPRKYGRPGDGAVAVRTKLGVTGRLVVVLGGLDCAGLHPRSIPAARFNSPGYDDSLDVARAVDRALAGEPDLSIVFKAHPGEQANVTATQIGAVRVIGDVDATDLIEAADVVVAGLTGLGFETLLLKRPLVLVARSAIQGVGAAYEALDSEELGAALRAALRDGAADKQERADRFLDGLLAHCLYATDDDVPAVPLAELVEHCVGLEALGVPDLSGARSALLSVAPKYTSPVMEYAQLFFDSGAGFNEAQSVRHVVERSTTRVQFDLPSDGGAVVSFRFDPLNDYATIRLGVILLVKNDREVVRVRDYTTNACSSDSAIYYFSHQDPQFLFEVPSFLVGDIKKVVIDFEILARGRAAETLSQTTQIAQLRQIMNKQYEQIGSLSHVVSDRDRQIVNLNQTVSDRDGRIANLHQTVSERDGQIAGLNRAIVDCNREIAELNRVLVSRDAQLAHFKQELAEHQNQLGELKQRLADREGRIAGLEQALADREGLIGALEQSIADHHCHLANCGQCAADYNGRIADLERAVADREDLIGDLSKSMSDHATRLGSVEQCVADRQGDIASLEQAVAERDRRLASLDQAVADRDGQVSALNQHVAARDGEIAVLNRRVTEAEGYVSSLLDSTSWRLTMPMRFVKHQLARGRHLARVAPLAFRLGGGVGRTLRKALNLYRRDGVEGLKRGVRYVQSDSVARLTAELEATAPESIQQKVFDPNDYHEWIRRYDSIDETMRARIRANISSMEDPPLISVIMPTYNANQQWLAEAIDSVKRQLYPNWELCIADDASTNPAIRSCLESFARDDARIKVVFREQNGHISAASNSALRLASGPWVALFDHDDLLSEHALYFVADAIIKCPNAGVIYSDEDKIDQSGNRFAPHFKSDWNPDLFFSQNYVSHLGVYRRSILDAIGGFRRGVEGSQDQDLLLRCLPYLNNDAVVHIPRVLYHWRVVEGSTALDSGEKSYTTEAGIKALSDYFASQSLAANVEMGFAPNTYRVRYRIPQPEPLVTLLIPTRDHRTLTETCVRSILTKTTYTNFEILVLDNGSVEAETLEFFRCIQQDDGRVKVLRYDHPFNYSAINNFGVQNARGSIIGLINNDIEVISPEWLVEMVGHAGRPEIGCVGAKLYYDNDALQHAGVIVSLGGVAGHSHKYFPRNHPGYFHRLVLPQNLSAVTAACLLVRREVFEEVGGLDETNLKVAFNDVDFCLKVREAGYRNLWTPYAEMYHHESVSRGHEDTPEKQARFQQEVQFMKDKWNDALVYDPYYSSNLTQDHENFSLAWPPRVAPI